MRQLREAFASAGYRAIAQADGAAELLRLAESQRPDVIIVDTESPTRDTLEQLALMDRAAPRPVVMFAGHGGLPPSRPRCAPGSPPTSSITFPRSGSRPSSTWPGSSSKRTPG
ncbi:ANTAR domain-containing response regulator [Chromobacterium violaceum]|uniref:ANTAR domain-containing response regulator n=1 Tax=Chromobacterium violaceum TaxID=536 RepID=UPI003DA82DC6